MWHFHKKKKYKEKSAKIKSNKQPIWEKQQFLAKQDSNEITS